MTETRCGRDRNPGLGRPRTPSDACGQARTASEQAQAACDGVRR
ncbi:unnamed protein product [[Actinomadura] parvosata subsp. kistnae]|nr:unnamed protein product [Actinomadura parvosata subsp. kistnae]